jgi:integrating conjugative element protein (TIGR03758 family)
MGSDITSSFQSGSGMDPSTLKTFILSITAAMMILIAGWLVIRLYEDWQDERISLGEFSTEVLLLLAILSFMLWFLTIY